jgi:hypothetical protein
MFKTVRSCLWGCVSVAIIAAVIGVFALFLGYLRFGGPG